MQSMHPKVLRLMAAICSTAFLYVFIGLSPNNRFYHNYKYAKTVFVVNPEPEPIFTSSEDTQYTHLATVPTLPTAIHQSLSSNDTHIVNTIETNYSSKIRDKSIKPFVSTKENKQIIGETVDDYQLNCDIHIAMIFTKTRNSNKSEDKVNPNKSIDAKLLRSLTSLSKYMNHKTHKICIHLISNKISEISAKIVIKKVLDQRLDSAKSLRFYFHDINKINTIIADLLPTLKRHFNYRPNSYYSHSLFFTSLAVHKYFLNIEKLIFLDIDIQINVDIKELYEEFGKFSAEALIGIAFDQQPVYHHILHEYRHKIDPNTTFGSPPPKGWPGFNSGVLLMNLKRMRESLLFNSLLNSQKIESLCKKYFFSGHLGDQDFYTLVSFENKPLFHVISCNWNRQLCQWWRYHGYRDIFDDYFRCDLAIKLLHGNCNSSLPPIR